MASDEPAGGVAVRVEADVVRELDDLAAFEEWFYSDEARGHWHAFTPAYKLARAAWDAARWDAHRQAHNKS